MRKECPRCHWRSYRTRHHCGFCGRDLDNYFDGSSRKTRSEM